MLLKCKMCGGDLQPVEGMTTVECEFCGTMQTIAVPDSEKKTNLFNRANRLRMASEFDKAAAVYENIVAEFPEEAEAYWGLCLCAYGIEYVDDPASGRKIPTCHRTLPESIMDSSNFEMACDYADSVAKKLYRSEAKEIDRLQKEILAIVANEAPYDVFICYKETDESGNRTEGSVLGQDIYDALTAKGMKVFFARITLEDKLGQQYEPYIYAALHSAKVMLAIGTSFEHYDAVWVKNEWSRYLDMASKDKSKNLIPCYKNIDAYDIPKEFRNLQAQDMNKLGWLQDLVRGVEKLCGKEQKAQTKIIEKTVVQSDSVSIDSLMARAQLFLEDGDFRSAEQYANKVLDINPKYAAAYIVKVQVAVGARKEGDLARAAQPLASNSDYQKAVRFADAAARKTYESYNQKIVERLEAERIAALYDKSCAAMQNAVSEADFVKIAEALESISDYADAAERASKCRKLAEKEHLHTARAAAIKKKITILASVIAAIAVTAACLYFFVITPAIENNQIKKAQEEAYQRAQEYYTAGDEAHALLAFRQAGNHLDSRQYAIELEKKYEQRVAATDFSEAVFGLKSDGTILISGEDFGDFDQVRAWNNITAIAAGRKHIVGLRTDGTVVTTAAYNAEEYDTAGWQNIAAIAAGNDHTVGLMNDGTVVAVGDNEHGQCDVSEWTGIKAIAAGGDTTVGIKNDGTVVVVGDKGADMTSVVAGFFQTAGWQNIVKVYVDDFFIIGIESDGTLHISGGVREGHSDGSRISYTREVLPDISSGAVGFCFDNTEINALQKDGTVVEYHCNFATSSNKKKEDFSKYNRGWSNIISLHDGDILTVGLCADGTVKVTRNSGALSAISRWDLW